MSSTDIKQSANFSVTAGVQVIPNLPVAGRSGRLHLVWVTPTGAAAQAVITDGSTGAGTRELANVKSSTAPDWSNGNDFDVEFQKGLWIVVTGAGADVIVTWE